VRVLVTGARGQLGWELARACQPLGEVVALDRAGCDLADPSAVRRVLREWRPAVVFNAAAYTAVDRAEDDEATALRVNAEGPAALAQEAAALGALLVHYSTDYVWDGSGERPWVETDPPSPVNAYGRTKLAGERAIAAAGGRWLVFRTSWVYAERGGNFPRTMLRLAAERDTLAVVADQIGAPTGARLIADASVHAAVRALAQARAADGAFESGLYNLVAGGTTSWHGVASAVVGGARRRGLPVRAQRIDPIPASQYPTRAQRPANSRMSTAAFTARFGLALPAWEQGVELLLDAIADAAPRPA